MAEAFHDEHLRTNTPAPHELHTRNTGSATSAPKQKCPGDGGARLCSSCQVWLSPTGKSLIFWGGDPGDLPCTGGTSERSCGLCPAGFFCPGLGLSSATRSCMTDSDWPLEPTVLPCPQAPYWLMVRRGDIPIQGTKITIRGHALRTGTMAITRAGTWSPVLCPPGTFTPQNVSGLQKEGDCSTCPPGHYCRVGQVWGKCPAGYFCPPGTSEVMAPGSRKSQTLCPQGQLCMEQCPPGFYCPEGSGEPILCPPYTLTATPGAQQKEDCGPCPPGHWCRAGAQTAQPCPAGHYCPGENETHPGAPQACPKHTYLAEEGGQSLAECLPCPSGYHCPWPGLSSFKDHPCPPGHWCPGTHGALPCPPGTFQTEPGASAPEDCELCPPGYYCPDSELRGQANVFPIPCQAGFECPAGAVTEVPCRAGSYCGPQTGVPPLCPEGFACPAGSSSYPDPGQRCLFPYYCPLGSAHPRTCPGGSEALNRSGLRVSAETCCQQCAAGTYHSQALDALPCQPCPAGFSCRQGSSSCTCWGTNRVFQKSDGSCICQTGHVSYNHRGLESGQDSDSKQDCQPQVSQRCPPGDIRLAATHKCVSPQMHDCDSFCRPGSGELSADLGICQCRAYVSAEELCDTQCLATAPQLSLAWSSSKKLILSIKKKAGNIIQREVSSTLGPDQPFPGSARVYLIEFGPHGIFGFIISSVDMVGSFLQDRSASHYPVYQRQHLLNSNPHWDFGAFRRLCHLVQETQFNLSRFAHRFLDPGTYVFRDNGQSESIAVVHVQEEGAVCSPGLAPIQPSSPYQLGRLGILRRELLLAPDWAAITGINLDRAARTEGLEGLCVAVPQV
ncbi:multiple epidermal growth factor-like domains protein 6 [Fukomys damarensis]|uniref:multiple epidermal growth factor-like domains protein 6 n=1 Tax=Fukomys damarensis TaxID=885580 RepID=UPI00145552E4|nr:multiple epidermal growth factor-like domains protein 6 [Fukomys damarensis]